MSEAMGAIAKEISLKLTYQATQADALYEATARAKELSEHWERATAALSTYATTAKAQLGALPSMAPAAMGDAGGGLQADMLRLEEFERARRELEQVTSLIEQLEGASSQAGGATDSAAEGLEGLGDAANGTKAPLKGAGDGLDELGGAGDRAGKKTDSLKKKMEGVVAPVKRVKDAFNVLSENWMFLRDVGGLVVTAIEAVGNAFTYADEIAANYDRTMKTFIGDLERVNDLLRENDALLRGTKPPTEVEKRLEEITGKREIAGRPGSGTDGLWAEWASGTFDKEGKFQLGKLPALEQQLEQLRRDAADMGLGEPEAFGPGMGLERLISAVSFQDLKAQLADIGTVRTELTMAQQTLMLLEQERASLLSRQAFDSMATKENLDDASKYALSLGENFMASVEGFVSGVQKGIVGPWQGRRDFSQLLSDFFAGLKDDVKKPVEVDARGARVTIHQKVEADNPAQLARASLLAGFTAVARQPIRAGHRDGSVRLANGDFGD